MSFILPDSGDSLYPSKGHSYFRLIKKILTRSVANTWPDARREWVLDRIFFAEPGSPGTCLCGHFPIREHCVLRNRENGNKVVVGNVCVTRFMGISAEKLFTALRRITNNRAASLNMEAVEYAYRKGWIDDWQRAFYLDTCRKRKLSPKQRAMRVQINELALQRAQEGRHNA